jgi:hypothetical protein
MIAIPNNPKATNMINYCRPNDIISKTNVFDKNEDNGNWPSNRTFVVCLFGAYFLFVLLRFSVTLLFEDPLIFGDELTYRYLAYSFYKYHNFYAIKNYGHVENMSNVLYSIAISPAFIFGNNFYIATKLINCLLINSVIFPSYVIMRQFVSARKALYTSVVVMFLPFFNIANYMMTENLYFPLFLWCFLIAYKYLTTRKIRLFILAVLLFLLLFFTKPTAIILVIAYIVTSFVILFVLKRHSREQKQLIIRAIVVFITLFSIVYLFKEQLQIHKMFGAYSSGMWSLASKWDFSAFLSHNFIVMSTSYLASFAFLYLLPFLVTLFALIHYFEQKNTNNIVFLGFVLLTFIFYLLSTIKFALITAKYEPFSRLHARYYFMTYPLFIYSFIAFGPSIKWNYAKKITLAACFCLLLLQCAIYFYPNFIARRSYGFFIDNIDLSGLLLRPTVYIVIWVILMSSIIAFYLRVRNRLLLLPFIVFFICFSMVQNIGYVYTLRSMHQKDPMTVWARTSRLFIQQNIPNLDNKVLMVGSDSLPMHSISFWLTYNYTDVMILKKNEEINMQRVSQDTEYIILFDDYKINIPFTKVASQWDGTHKCLIIKTQKKDLLPA